MTLSVEIAGGAKNNKARVTNRGQLVVGALDFSQFYTATVTVANTPVNLIKPLAGKNFVITALVLAGDRNIGVNGAITEIYENSAGPTSATVTKRIYIDEIGKQTRATLTNLNILVTASTWVNVKADAVQVRANLAGYYIPILPEGEPSA